MNEFRNSSSQNSNGRAIGLVIGIFLLPILYLFEHYGQSVRGLAVACMIGMFVTVAYVKRKIRRNLSFLLFMAVLFGIHLLTILIIPLPSSYFPGIIALPFSIIDLFLILALVRLFEKLTGNGKAGRTPLSEAPLDRL